MSIIEKKAILKRYVMSDYDNFLVLRENWAESLKKAKLKQSIIADKMNSFFKGNGLLPTAQELTELEILWGLHLKDRQAINLFIAKTINSKSVKKIKSIKDYVTGN